MSLPDLRILVVCTANHCRSPMAEFLLRSALNDLGMPASWSVSSAGTRARDGIPMHPYAAEVLRERGVTISGWTSRGLDRARIDGADLVLTSTGANRAEVVTINPRGVRKTFRLLDFGALARSISLPADNAPGSADAFLKQIVAARGRVTDLSSPSLDLADPMGNPIEAFRQTADVISATIETILRPMVESLQDEHHRIEQR